MRFTVREMKPEEADGLPIRHSNINRIVFGQEAYMHLHIWELESRKLGHGSVFVRESIARHFEMFQLQKLYCEPYALNPAPNRTLPKAGFKLLKSHETTPGWINFQQRVNLWMLDRDTALVGRGK